MKKKLYSIFSALLIAILMVSPVSAGGMKISFRLGSLVADTTAFGLGNTDWIFELDASGTASVICTNYGSNDVPGQSFPHIDGRGSTAVPKEQITKNGKASFSITAKPDEEINPIIAWDAGGCSNPNWTARIDFVYWEHATISRIDPVTGAILDSLEYQCVTTRTSPNSTPSTFDDGTVSCSQIN